MNWKNLFVLITIMFFSAFVLANSSCHSGSNGEWSYCSSSCQCSLGEGDCDSDKDCDSGLKCMNDAGIKYGFYPAVDVCEKPTAIPLKSVSAAIIPLEQSKAYYAGHSRYCSTTNKCNSGEGDCDNDRHCKSGLSCSWDAGPKYGFASWVDVCEKKVKSKAKGFGSPFTAFVDLFLESLFARD